MQVVWIYLSQRRGGGDSDLPFASKVKFSSRVHLLDKIGKKNTSNGKQNYFNTLALTWLFLEAQCFLTCLFHVKWEIEYT